MRLVSFYCPGYGRSDPAPFSLASIAQDTAAVADALGIGDFATWGQSGRWAVLARGRRGAGVRVTLVGVASGRRAVPFRGARDSLDDGDSAAYALLPGDAEGAAVGFASGFETLVRGLRQVDPCSWASGFAPMLSDRDKHLLADPEPAVAFGTSVQESLRQGCLGGGWDNVSWVGPWDVDLDAIECPVLLWYGDEDRFCSPSHGIWLDGHLRDSTLVLRAGEGHLGFLEHTAEMLSALIAPAAA